jgi:hypothetical protein
LGFLQKKKKKKKSLGINLTKEVKDIYNENYNTLKNESEENTRRWKDLLCLYVGRIDDVKMAIVLKVICRCIF